MKRILMLVLVAGLLPGSAFAVQAAQEGTTAGQAIALETASEAEAGVAPVDDGLSAVIAATAKEIAAEDAAALGVEGLPAVQDGDGIHTWKMVVGVGLIAGGAGLIANGFALRQDEPDPFGRVKDADAYVAMGVGASFITVGAFVVRGALAGRGF